MKTLTFCFAICLASNLAIGQSSAITGFVKDVATNEPVTGALIYSSIDSTVSDKNGAFELSIIKPGPLTAVYLGYQNQVITISENETQRIVLLHPSLLQLNEVVISGTTGKSLKNTPNSTQIISPEMLQRDAPFSTTTAINRIPGVFMHSGAINTSRITIRGIGSRSLYGTNKIKAYLNDIPLTDGSGNSSIEDIDQSIIGRMEITKGPNSSQYGAGQGGVIKILPAQAQKTGVTSNFTFGSFGNRRWLQKADYAGKNIGITALYSDYKSDGYRDNSEYSRQQGALLSRYILSDRSFLEITLIQTQLKAYIPSSIDGTDFSKNPQKAAFTWGQSRGYESYQKLLTGASFTHKTKSDWQIKATLFYKYRNGYEPRPFNILDELTQSAGLRLVTRKSWNNVVLSMGTELFKDKYEWKTFENNYTPETMGSVEGNILSNNTEDRQNGNLFVESQWEPFSGLNFTAGLNMNATSYDYVDQYSTDGNNNSGTYRFDPVISPKLGATYLIDPHNTLFLNFSHGFSPPSLEETLYPDGQINPDIKPESGWNYEAGLRGNTQHLTYDFTAYYMHINNLLVAQRTAEDQFIGVNAGLNNHFGMDLLVNTFFDFGDKTINFFNSLAFMNYHFGDFQNNGVNYDGNQLTGVPSYSLNSGIELINDQGFFANISGQYVGEIPMNDANDLYSESYFILRSKIGYQKEVGHWQFNVSGGIDNLTNQHYASMLLINAVGFGSSEPRYYYPGNPRNFFAQLSVKYVFL